MKTHTQTPGAQLKTLSQKLRQVHSRLVHAEKSFHPPMTQVQLLDRLLQDPAWAWLRPLSRLMADIDHALEQDQPPTEYDLAVASAHVRELLSGDAAETHPDFADRYRGLLQLDPELASIHGELKILLKSAPTEAEDEAERLHHRHQWAMRCKHQLRGQAPGSG